jgi:hypothetical protein
VGRGGRVKYAVEERRLFVMNEDDKECVKETLRLLESGGK